MLAERLEFFIPKLMDVMKPWQWLAYLFFWSLFVTVIDRHDLESWSEFMISFTIRMVQNTLCIMPALFIVDYLRPILRRTSIIKASVYVLAILMMTSTVSMILVLLVMINIGWVDYDLQGFILEVIFDLMVTAGFTLAFLLYFLGRYREMHALQQSFERKLKAQNDMIKARITPHFLFNTINTLVSLIETNPARASQLLQHASALFRASFNGAREISFEEEIALCEHYLAIEYSRLSNKLYVQWQLPDEDVMYDMVITALTLQSILERMMLSVVEMTTEAIYIDITVIWHHHRVIITINIQLPKKTLMINHDLRQHMNFYVQAERLQTYFGQSAEIKSQVTNTQIVTVIDYPLQDVSL
ncbi:histidine kinase [Psychrobacter sp.]|uniref:histidine kinase n=1 Tax=Psychrobacter sp. TaxID=56811 RepID=UPI003F9D88C8